jgi:hypothetical protein
MMSKEDRTHVHGKPRMDDSDDESIVLILAATTVVQNIFQLSIVHRRKKE